MNKQLLKRINYIEIYQVIGGVLGLLLMLYLIMTTNLAKYQNGLGYFSIGTPFVFFGFCIYSGVVLNQKKFALGMKLVIISLLFQLIAFDVFGFAYTAVNGIGIKAVLDLTKDFILGFEFHPSHFLFQASSNNGFILKINLIALAMLFFALKVNNEIVTKPKENLE